jgi:hypothetical protein
MGLQNESASERTPPASAMKAHETPALRAHARIPAPARSPIGPAPHQCPAQAGIPRSRVPSRRPGVAPGDDLGAERICSNPRRAIRSPLKIKNVSR